MKDLMNFEIAFIRDLEEAIKYAKLLKEIHGEVYVSIKNNKVVLSIPKGKK